MSHRGLISAALVFLAFAIASCIDTNRFLRDHPEYEKQKAPLSFLIIVAVLLVLSYFF